MLKVWYHMFARTYLHLSLRPNSVTTDSNTNGWGMNDAGMGTWGGDKNTSLADLGDNGKLGDTGTAPTKFSSLNDTLFDTGSNYDNGAATEAGFYGVGGYGGNNERARMRSRHAERDKRVTQNAA
ncbi:MAG: hypothetical protein HOO99_06495 [Hyphomicrobiaceae bacterium]|nr:hypothetical protein [Hyphomicrobiaceae bacterium]